MKKHKGQAVVEFAVVLPLFLLVLFGIIYSGMLFYDYSSLSNLARSSAREAAITQNLTDSKRTEIENFYKTKTNDLLTSLYTPDATNPFKISYSASDNSVGVTITMKRNDVPILVEMVLPEEYKIEYYMKRDEQSS